MGGEKVIVNRKGGRKKEKRWGRYVNPEEGHKARRNYGIKGWGKNEEEGQRGGLGGCGGSRGRSE